MIGMSPWKYLRLQRGADRVIYWYERDCCVPVIVDEEVDDVDNEAHPDRIWIISTSAPAQGESPRS